MEQRINQEALSALLHRAKEDPEMLDFIYAALMSFAEYIRLLPSKYGYQSCLQFQPLKPSPVP